MSFFSYALGALILILVLLRQVRVRPVPRVFQPRLPVVIGVIGLFEMFSYAGDHHVSSTAWVWVARHAGRRRARPRRPARPLHAGLDGQRLGAAPGQRRHDGALAGLAARALRRRRRTDHAGAAGLVGSSFLLYLGVTLGVQYYVVYRRAQPLWAAARPRRRPAAAV